MYETENPKLFDIQVVAPEGQIYPEDRSPLLGFNLVCLSSILSPGGKGAAFHMNLMVLQLDFAESGMTMGRGNLFGCLSKC